MNNSFATIAEIIKHRRSTKPAQLNGNIIPDEQINELLELANWAPNHGNTAPWNFIVYTGEGLKKFCREHAELYKTASAENFLQANYDKILHNGDNTSHIIVAIMQRGNLPKVPVIEEIAAASASIQNILLGATALGLASFWSTSGMAHHTALKEYLQLRHEDVIMGLLFLGYTDTETNGKRNAVIEKVKWVK